eukprot:CAMPEP_0177251660 /NCGR_PEP_ID=MMETSP0367-20130122/54092_1 /TAXON_ID=447022 ORGANISM="Scrippsiella hangoei-like, Strain SHHI-4" /NCGR_SAMPLE_ID=MMETSP0367 /ASSEMBLY_ACC=CAM_ASM_000362 /LENGTH=147 /DNA_ID=CAMNT_0018704623 /DNA_START=193 /DNA_END=637 /DNA_ORIENTATION=-
MVAKWQLRQRWQAKSIGDGRQGDRSTLEIDFEVPVIEDVGRQHQLAELESQCKFGHRGLKRQQERLRAKALLADRHPLVGQLLHREVLVPHVAATQNILPRLPRVSRVEELGFLLMAANFAFVISSVISSSDGGVWSTLERRLVGYI